jgi:MYXO-CTERM domain-containing protein
VRRATSVSRRRRALALLLAGAFAACDADRSSVSQTTLPEDFRGPTIREFFIEGISTVTVEPTYVGEAAREARALELVGYKHLVIEWYLFKRISDVYHPDSGLGSEGLHSHVRNGAMEDLELTPLDESTWSFHFRSQISAPLELFDLLDAEPEPEPDAGTSDDARFLRVPMPVLGNEVISRLTPGEEWYRSSAAAFFDPATYTGEMETIDLTVTPEERSRNGYIDYDRLLADGRLTVGIHIGWDYYPQHYDVRHAVLIYDWLIRRGFHSPTPSFDEYNIDSGPLDATVTIRGTPIVVEVTLVYAYQGDPSRTSFGRQLKEAMQESFRDREVVIYLGHSSNRGGFLLANWYAVAWEDGAIMEHELPLLEMSSDYQIVLADGCQTYWMGEPFLANPAKAGGTNLDLLSTTNFSVTPDGGLHAIRLLQALIGETDRPPRGTSYDELLAGFNSRGTYLGLYGVHGIDDNPHLNPLADLEQMCLPCVEDIDCLAVGNACVGLRTGRFCLPECLDDDACPAGTLCLVDDEHVVWGRPGGYCTPPDAVCTRVEPEPGAEAGPDAADPEAGDDSGDDVGVPPERDVPEDDGATPPGTEGGSDGCGCRIPDAHRSGVVLSALLLALALVRRRRP